MRIGRKHILIGQCAIEEIQQKLSEFPKRYHHFRLPKQKNIWTFRIISMNNNYCVIQLIDKTFEPPRGNISSDQPHIYIHFLQEDADVNMAYWMKWQKWKVALIILGIIFYSSISLANICINASSIKHTILNVGLCLCVFCGFALWLAKNIRHDRLTIRIFEELLQRNFSTIQFYP